MAKSRSRKEYDTRSGHSEEAQNRVAGQVGTNKGREWFAANQSLHEFDRAISNRFDVETPRARPVDVGPEARGRIVENAKEKFHQADRVAENAHKRKNRREVAIGVNPTPRDTGELDGQKQRMTFPAKPGNLPSKPGAFQTREYGRIQNSKDPNDSAMVAAYEKGQRAKARQAKAKKEKK